MVNLTLVASTWDNQGAVVYLFTTNHGLGVRGKERVNEPLF